MVKILASGYYCEQCANDLKYHGLFHVPADVDPLLHFYHTLTGRENEKVVVTGEA